MSIGTDTSQSNPAISVLEMPAWTERRPGEETLGAPHDPIYDELPVEASGRTSMLLAAVGGVILAAAIVAAILTLF